MDILKESPKALFSITQGQGLIALFIPRPCIFRWWNSSSMPPVYVNTKKKNLFREREGQVVGKADSLITSWKYDQDPFVSNEERKLMRTGKIYCRRSQTTTYTNNDHKFCVCFTGCLMAYPCLLYCGHN